MALMLGAALRLYRLGYADLSADEAAAWAGASAPTLRAVVERERLLDPGKLALYDLALHAWIAAGGDGVGWMRTFSAMLGVCVVALMFAVARELMLGLTETIEFSRIELAGAFAALVAAANLTLVNQARTVRMYPLTLALELAQVFCLLRTLSGRTGARGRVASAIGVALLTMLAISANFTAVLLVAAEVPWLAILLAARHLRRSAPAMNEPGRSGVSGAHLLSAGLALAAGIALLALIAPVAPRNSIEVVRAGVLNWSRLRSPWWPLMVLRGASGKAPFPMLLGLALYGAWRMRRRGNIAALGFLLFWILGPIALVMAISYAFTPFEEARYVIGSVAAFFILAGIGVAEIADARLGLCLLALLLVLSLDHVRRNFARPEFVQWRAATALALHFASPDEAVGVVPAYAVNAARYYTPSALRAKVEPATPRCDAPQPRVLILTGTELMSRENLAAIRACAPTVLARWRLIEVRRR
ncbi:MAG TPA: hypothetical protein VKT27_14120 [Candidatus Binataceae bacterium]|nr:hypothetical protein [Candidatus Binataceae bacterium]